MVRGFLYGFVGALVVFVGGGGAVTALVLSQLPDSSVTAMPPPPAGPYEVQLVYAIPADGIDLARDRDGSISASVDAAQRWFEAQTGGRRIAFAGKPGRPTVLRARLSRTDAELRAFGDYIVVQIEHELRAQGLAREGTLYGVYYEGTADHCGLAAARPPDMPGTAMALFLDGLAETETPCGGERLAARGEPAGYWEFGLIHEVFHLLGAVPDCAPHEGASDHEYGGSHVDEPGDLMYHGDAGMAEAPVLDIGRDDYFGHGRADCFDAVRSPYLRPLAPVAEPPVRGFAEARLAGGCSTGGQESRPESGKLSITIANATADPLEVRWIVGDGRVERYDRLPPWGWLNIRSPIGTAWVIVDAAGACLTRFTTPDHPVRVWYHGQRGNRAGP